MLTWLFNILMDGLLRQVRMHSAADIRVFDDLPQYLGILAYFYKYITWFSINIQYFVLIVLLKSYEYCIHLN